MAFGEISAGRDNKQLVPVTEEAEGRERRARATNQPANHLLVETVGGGGTEIDGLHYGLIDEFTRPVSSLATHPVSQSVSQLDVGFVRNEVWTYSGG